MPPERRWQQALEEEPLPGPALRPRVQVAAILLEQVLEWEARLG